MNYEAKFNKKGNIKLGSNIWTFNKLAGNIELNGCKGTCGKHCTGCFYPNDPKRSKCYVFNSYRMYGWDKSTVMNAHIKNTNTIRKNIELAFNDLDMQLKRAHNKPVAVRIHSSGELETPQELIKWFGLAVRNPKIPFYIYTKNYEVVEEVVKRMQIPDNFFINISIWHKEGVECYEKLKCYKNIRAFVYCDDYKYGFKMDAMCPAYDAKGKMNHEMTCDKCGICFGSKCKICGCYDH